MDYFKGNRRPATNLKSGPFTYPVLDETKYTTDPPAPIVLRTRDDSPADTRVPSAKSNKLNNNSVQGIGNVSNVGSTLTLAKRRQSNINNSNTNSTNNTIELQQMSRPRSDSTRGKPANSVISNSVIIEVEKPIKSKEKKNDGDLVKPTSAGSKQNMDVEDDINKKPIRRRSRRHARQRMTDIV